MKHSCFLKHKQKINKIKNMGVPSYIKKINFIMMKNFKISLLIVLLSFQFSLIVLGQNRIFIKGTVVSQSDGLGLPNASVVELDKNNRTVKGVITDLDGNFNFSITDKSHKLQVSFIGYKTQVIEIGDKTVFNIMLEEDIATIEAVEIKGERSTSIGVMSVKDRDLTIPVEKISAKEIEDVQASSIDEALQGRLAGVDIVSNSGDPGGGMSIRIRGVNTLKPDAKPLIVIDGVPYKTEIASDFNFATANEEGYSQMLNIPIDDIKEISVFKDAAATALYGTEAANGILYITTKRGTKARKPQVSYTYKGTYTFQPDPLPLLNGDQYSTLILEAYMNRTGLPLNTETYKEFSYDPGEPYYYYNYGQNTNWLKAIQQDGYTNEHSISISGGGNKAAYRISSNYLDQTGVTIGTYFSRLTTRVNLDYSISNKLRLSSDFSYAHSKRGSNYDKNIRAVAYRKMPNMSIFEYDENGNLTPNYFSPENNIQGYYPTTYNVLAMAKYAEDIYLTDRIDSKFSLNYDIIKGLKYTFDVAFGLNNERENKFLPQRATGLDYNNSNSNRADNYDKDEYSIYTNNRLAYNNTIGAHSITATLNVTSYDFTNREFFSAKTNTASSDLKDPSVDARIINVASKTGQSRTNSILGLINYSLLDRYIFALGVRREGNSKFDKANRYGFFPSISASWRISGEPFMKGLTFIDDLRLKYSYGENGQTPSENALFFSNYNTISWTYLGVNGVYPASMQLEKLKWETFITNNFGITTELLKNRLTLDFELYKNITRDMLGDASITTVSGYTGIKMNIGTMESRGWDFSFRSYPIKNKDLTVTFDFNIASNYDVLTKVSEDYSLKRAININNGVYQPGLQINNPLGSFYGFVYEGVYRDEKDLIATDANGNPIYDANGEPVKMIFNYPVINYQFQPGDAKYKDINHDGNINYLDIVYLGKANPDFTGGFGSRVDYKGFSANIYFYTRIGNYVVNMTQMYGENMYSYDNQTTAVLRRWRNIGDSTDIPRALYGYGYNWLGSSRYVYRGDFLRLKYITLTYNIPQKFVKKIGFSNLKVSTTINNLLTFTKYPGQDPEISIASKGDIYKVGYDYSNTPRAREITLNITAIF